MFFGSLQGCRLRHRKVASCRLDACFPGFGCKLQVLQASRLQVQSASKFCKVAGCTAGRNIVPTGYVDLIGPNPEDRTISKRHWEASVLSWRTELRAVSSLLQGISV